MKYLKKVTPFIFLAVLSGCVTLPTGPSVNVMPAPDKPFEKFRMEDANCRQWGEQQLGRSIQETYDRNLAAGAFTGTAIGAGLGAILGSASGHAGAGAAIGAVGGLIFGAAAGSDSGQIYGRDLQRRYDNAYAQCMYSYGNQLPAQYRAVLAAPPTTAVAPLSPAGLQGSTSLPGMYYNEAPEFIYSPSLNLYIAVDVPYDLFYTGSEYFYFYDGRWYRGPDYDGPWSYAPRRSYPSVFLRYRIDSFRQYREAEFRLYERDKAHNAGRLYRPEYRAQRVVHKEKI
jgi:outer membrane lipoprotein SlyB